MKKLENEDKLFVDKVTPFLNKLNSLIDDTNSAGFEDGTVLYNSVEGIKWDVISGYFANTNIVLPEGLIAKNGNFTIDDVVSILKFYNSASIESDLVEITDNLPTGEAGVLTIDTNSLDTIMVAVGGYNWLLNLIAEDIFSNDQIYELNDSSFYTTEKINNVKYEFKIVFDAEKMN